MTRGRGTQPTTSRVADGLVRSQGILQRVQLVPPGRDATAVAEVRVRDDLGPWRDAWDGLVLDLDVPTPFLRSWWLDHVAWAPARYVLVVEGRRLLGGMALQEDRVLGVRRLCALGQGRLVPDYLEVLARPGERSRVERALRAWCRDQRPAVFDVDGVVADGGFGRVLPGAHLVERAPSPYLRLSPDTEVVARLPGRLRNTVRRARRKHEAAGVVHRVVPPEDADGALERLRRLHEQRWGRASGFLGDFGAFAAAALDGVTRGEVVFHELWHEDRCVAVQVDLRTGDRVNYFQAGRDVDASLPSLGTVLLATAAEHARRQGAQEYDLLRGEHAYKGDWADDAHTLVHLRGGVGLRGRGLARLLTARQRLGAVKGRLRRRLVAASAAARERLAAATATAREQLVAAGATARDRVARTPATVRPRTRRGRRAERRAHDAGRRGDVEVIRDPDRLAQLRDDWDELTADVPGPNSELDWLLAHAAAGPAGSLHVVVVHDGDRLGAVAPLVLEEGRLTLPASDAAGFRYRDEQQLARLVDAVHRCGHPLLLPALVEGSPTDRLLEQRASRRLLRAMPWPGGPSIPLDESWTDPVAKLSRGRRADVRRARRRAEDHGEVQLEFHDGGPAGRAIEPALEELVALEASGWKGRAGTALRFDDVQRETLRGYLTAPAVRDRVRIARMRIDGETVAIDLNVVAGNRLWGLKGAYDERFAQAAPGLLLKALALEHAAAEGLERFEYLGRSAPFKEMWGTGPTPLRRIQCYPPTPSGGWTLLGDGLGHLRRELTRRRERRRDDGAAARRALRRPGEAVPSRHGTVKVVTDAAELERLRSEWGRLRADVPGPASQLDWVLAYTGVREHEPPRVLTVRRLGQLTGVAPLVRTAGPAPRLKLLNLSRAGLLYRDDDQLARLVDALHGLRWPISLDVIPVGTPGERALSARRPRRRLRRVSERLGGPSLALDERWHDPLSQLSRSTRKSLRRARRRADELGEVTFETVTPGADLERLRALFDEFVALEGSGWKAAAGTAMAVDPERRELLWRHLSAPDVRERVRVCRMTIDDRLVAASILLVQGDRCWAEKAAYDEAAGRCSPGQLLTAHEIEWAAREGFARFEFAGDQEPYKASWGDGQPLRSFKVYGPSPAGCAALVADALGKARRELRARAPWSRSDA